MKITKITKGYSKTIPTGNYASKKILVSLEAELTKGERVMDVAKELDKGLIVMMKNAEKNLK